MLKQDFNSGEADIALWKLKMSGFYAVPAVRFCLHGVADMVGIVLHCWLIFSFKNPEELDRMRPKIPLLSDCETAEMAWMLFHGGNILDQLYQVAQFRALGAKEVDEFRILTRVFAILFSLSFACRLIMEAFDTESEDGYYWGMVLYDVYQTSMSINSIVIVVTALRFLAVYRPIGVLIIVMSGMVADLITFIALLAAVTIGFSVALAGLQLKGNSVTESGHDPFTGGDSALFIPFWAVYGEFAPVRHLTC
eukprot:6626636-Prymnesium_polylepis.1